jgi:hypothetical protein
MFSFRIELYMPGILISGNYEMKIYRRLSSALNSDLQPHLTLKSAIVTPVHQPQKAERLSTLLINRAHIVLAATLKEPPPPPDHPVGEMVAPREEQEMMFFTSLFSIRARYYKRPALDIVEALNETTEDFIPLNQAHIFPFDERSPIARDFVCLGRAHMLAAYQTTDYESI